MDPLVVIGLNAVIMAVTEGSPRILTVRRAEHSLAGELKHRTDIFQRESPDAIPFGPFDPASDRTLELGLRRWVREQTGLESGLCRAAVYIRRPEPRSLRRRGRPARYFGGLPGTGP